MWVVLGSILVVSSSVFAQTPSCIVQGTFNTGDSLTLECTGAGTLSAAEINAALSGLSLPNLAALTTTHAMDINIDVGADVTRVDVDAGGIAIPIILDLGSASTSISTMNDNEHGVYVRTDGTGGVNIQNSGTITTTGTAAHGLFAHNTGGTMNAPNTGNLFLQNFFGGTIAVASGSYGVYALNEGVIQPTSLFVGAAVFAENNNPSIDISVRAENKGTGSIITNRAGEHGVYARTSGTGRVEAINSATGCTQADGSTPRACIQTSSTETHGVFAENAGGTI